MSTYERLTPTEPQLVAFAQNAPEEPVVLLSLLRFRARAAYPRDYKEAGADATGADAFRRYAEVAARRIQAVGGQILWAAPASMTLVGPPNERWDEVFVADYPSRQAFLSLQSDAEYEAALVHWTAALAECRVFACKRG